jgi:hypothetical protein
MDYAARTLQRTDFGRVIEDRHANRCLSLLGSGMASPQTLDD